MLQAIRQFTPPSDRDPQDTDNDSENPLGNTGIWVQTHTIWYRPASDQEQPVSTSPKKTKSESKSSRSSKKKGEKKKVYFSFKSVKREWLINRFISLRTEDGREEKGHNKTSAKLPPLSPCKS